MHFSKYVNQVVIRISCINKHGQSHQLQGPLNHLRVDRETIYNKKFIYNYLNIKPCQFQQQLQLSWYLSCVCKNLLFHPPNMLIDKINSLLTFNNFKCLIDCSSVIEVNIICLILYLMFHTGYEVAITGFFSK